MLKKGGVRIKPRADEHGCLFVVKEWCPGRAPDTSGSSDGGLGGSEKNHYRLTGHKLETPSSLFTSKWTLKHSSVCLKQDARLPILTYCS